MPRGAAVTVHANRSDAEGPAVQRTVSRHGKGGIECPPKRTRLDSPITKHTVPKGPEGVKRRPWCHLPAVSAQGHCHRRP